MTENITARHAITEQAPPRYEAKISVTEDIGQDEPFEYEDFLTATWNVFHSGLYIGGERDDASDQGYWLICGDNTGSQQLVVYPHMIPALIDLLHKLQEVKP